MRKVRVLLVNTGAVIDFSSYFSFLFRMFTDIAIMPLPLLLRYPLALLIATVRPFFGYHKYRKIGKSPLIEIMHTQAELLRERLKGYDIEVYPCCLYSKPLLDEFLSDKSFNVTVIIPQFPHYSKSTTGSIEIRVCHKNLDSVKIVRSYHDHELFIKMWAYEIERVWQGETIVYVAHSIPVKLVKEGDPYVDQVKETAKLISKFLGTDKYKVAFSSAMPFGKWVGPSIEEVIKNLEDKDKGVVIVPISFVNEHVETLYDLDYYLRSVAKSQGIKVYKRVRVPYDSPLLFDVYVDLLGRVLEVGSC